MSFAGAIAPATDGSSARLTDLQNGANHSSALRHRDMETDYQTLRAAVDRVAGNLVRKGVRADDVVAFTATRDPACVILLWAIARVGAVCMPLDPSFPDARLHDMLADARPRLLVAPRSDLHRYPRALPHCEREELDVDAAAPQDHASAELLYVLFTSGSTGRPKGVAMRHAAFAGLIDWHRAHPRLGAPACTLQFAPLGFDVAFQEIFSTFATGGTLVLPEEHERRDPYALLELLSREKVERLFVPYVALQAIAEAVNAGGTLPAMLRDVVTAGEQLRVTPAIRSMFAALPRCVLHNHYGPTETHVVTAHELAGDPVAWPELPPIGRPLPHVRLRVVDESLQAVPEGAEGELLLGGRCLAAGYVNQPALTAERFIEHDGQRWYRSGDRVRFADGYSLEYLGRIDSQLKVGGYRIEPGEIEAVMARHPAVAEVVVVAGGTDAERRLVAHIVSNDRHAEEAALIAGLRAHCEQRLADYLVPRQFVLHAALPLTASGKIDRRALANMQEQAPLSWPESATLEKQLRALWQQLLDLPTLDPHANLFDQGARSLTVIRALNELRGRGFRNISAAQIYEHPTVAALAGLLQGGVEVVADTGADVRGRNQRVALARFSRKPGRMP